MVQDNKNKTVQEDPQKSQPLTEEQMQKAVEQIVFDLGCTKEQAVEWAKEAEKTLLERNTKVTKEVVTVVADAKHIDDEDVPAELVPREQGAKKWPGEDLAKGVVNAVKETYSKVKN